MNRHVLGNLDQIIARLEIPGGHHRRRCRRRVRPGQGAA
jgi:hypothetical protein